MGRGRGTPPISPRGVDTASAGRQCAPPAARILVLLAQALRVTALLIAAVVAPAGVLQAAGSGGWKASSPLAESGVRSWGRRPPDRPLADRLAG
jgi:hypothetical protein